MTNLNQTHCMNVPISTINHLECLISRVIGSIILIVSLFSIIFNIRFLYWSSSHRHIRSRHYSVILSMIVSSFSVIIVISPSVFFQCFTCYRWCSPFICRFEGFVNYLNGCVHMFMLMMISIIRYSTVLQSQVKKQTFHQHSYLAVLVCWLCGLIFAVPPLLNWNKYIPEGIGFHCGLDWFDRSISSRIYFLFMFLFVYFVPLIVLFVVNIYVYCVIRQLLRATVVMAKSNIVVNVSDQRYHSTSFTSSSSSSRTTTQSEKFGFILSTNCVYGNSRYVVRQTSNSLQINNLVRLNRLKADRRFAIATIFLVTEYLLSWTPYAIIALFYLFNLNLVGQRSIVMTISAFIAKVAMILNPFIYIATVNSSQLESIFYCKQCSCSYCRSKRTNRTL